jgi:predicted short-subunit dehydrogenase-like oxidoreductase (DUF2520 family)
MIRHVCIIGGGNVAWHLCHLINSTHTDTLITVLDRSNDLKIQQNNKLVVINSLVQVPIDADFYILAVMDSSIAKLVIQLVNILNENAIIVHTSGTTSLEALDPFVNTGCLWPIQSLTAGIEVNANRIPWAICSEKPHVMELLITFVKSINSPALPINESQKVDLHLGAVIINNFTNHLYHLTSEYLISKNLSIDLLNPLFQYTVDKLSHTNAKDAQTGPARRNDQKTIERQLELLNHVTVLHELYELMSESIRKTYFDDGTNTIEN